MCYLAPKTAEDSLWTKNGGAENFTWFIWINKFVEHLREKLQEERRVTQCVCVCVCVCVNHSVMSNSLWPQGL